jgi:hypothetical protein
MSLDPICILYYKQCITMNNIEYVGFPGLGFQGKNIYIMFVFSIVYFLFFFWISVCSRFCTRLEFTRCLQDFIECFNCLICLWMIGCALLMVNFKFLSQGFNDLIDEMCALIIHKDLLASKPSYDIIKYEAHSCSCTTVLNCSCFYPSGQILDRGDYVSSSCALPW